MTEPAASRADAADVLTLTVERLAWRGRGVARPAGLPVVLVEPGVLPGETIQARVTARKKDYWQAQAEAIEKPSPWRVPHPCLHADRCGGSPFGIVEPTAAVELKAELLRHTMRRALGQAAESAVSRLAVIPSPSPWGYRFRAQVHVAAGKPHFRALGSHQLVPLSRCLLLAEPLDAALAQVASRLPEGRHTIAASPVDGAVLAHTDPGEIRVALPGCGEVGVPPGVFFQANQLLNPALVQAVLGWTAQSLRVVDLFAGAGNFALPLAACGHEVLAMESSGPGVEAGRRNARRLGLEARVRWLEADLHRGLPAALTRFAPEAVVVDPPRIGAKGLAAALARMPSVRQVVWISCDVVNSLRDVRPLLASGFALGEVTLFDMFPGTWHMEVAMVCRRQSLD